MKLIRSLFIAIFLLAVPSVAQAARTAIAPITATHNGVVLSFTPSDQVNGNSFRADPHTALVVQNTSGAPITLTIHTSLYVDGDVTNGLKVPDRLISVPAGVVGITGPFTGSLYRQSDGFVWIDCAASMNLMVLQIIPGTD